VSAVATAGAYAHLPIHSYVRRSLDIYYYHGVCKFSKSTRFALMLLVLVLAVLVLVLVLLVLLLVLVLVVLLLA
jgi:hypothetical protein